MLYTIDELCEYLGVGKTTVWLLRKEGKIPYFKVGRKVLFRKADIDEWMANGGTEVRDDH